MNARDRSAPAIEMLFERPPSKPDVSPDVSFVLLDWCARESFHALDYFTCQTVPRDRYEIIWIEYYDRVAPEIRQKLDACEKSGAPPVVDKWLRMNMPREAYYHKHLMYNLGIALAAGRIVVICDSDAMVRDTLVESIVRTFDEDPNLALHLDEVRNVNRGFYPFNSPSIDDILAGDCINWSDGTTAGLADQDDPIHSLNYGACLCAKREDLISIGGADEHIDYLGHVCGPYELTWRLVNAGRTERWHEREFLYHTWHPGTDGDQNYVGPHDGRNVSTTALALRRTGRVMPLVENGVIRRLRLGHAADGDRRWLSEIVNEDALREWRIDEVKDRLSAGRAAFGQKRFADAVACWEQVISQIEPDSLLWSDLGWARYFIDRRDDAQAAFERAIALDPDNVAAHRGHAWVHRQANRFEAAIEAFSRALELLDPADRLGRHESHRGRAWSWFHAGEHERAIEDFMQAVALTGRDTRNTLEDLYRGLGWSHFYRGRAETSGDWFERALDVIDDNQEAERQDARKGREAARLARPAAAQPAPALAARPAPKPAPQPVAGPTDAALLSELMGGLGWALQREGLHLDALARFDEARQLDPISRAALNGRGWSLLHLHRYQEAIEQFSALIEGLAQRERSALQQAARGRAWARYRAGRFAEAVADFTTALRETDNADASTREDIFLGRARAYFRLGKRGEAMRDAAARHGRLAVSPAGLAADVYGSMATNNVRRLLSRQ